ncbi:hypothetical protein K1719_025704 [Acacia pycnantha]|nr:hypothetical protein K1719_025704 [Acacia pycnantha]
MRENNMAKISDIPIDESSDQFEPNGRDQKSGSGYMTPSATNPLYEGLGLYDMASSHAVQSYCSASPHQTKVMSAFDENGSCNKIEQIVGVKVTLSCEVANKRLRWIVITFY